MFTVDNSFIKEETYSNNTKSKESNVLLYDSSMLNNNLNTPSDNEKLRDFPPINQSTLPLNLSYSFGFDEAKIIHNTPIAKTSLSHYKKLDHEAKLKSFMQNK